MAAAAAILCAGLLVNPAMRGYRAVSGHRTIQLVSPVAPASPPLVYRDGLMIAVHEFTHLALDEIDPSLPDWLDEGAAVYFGPDRGRAFYERACRSQPILRAPSYDELTYHYTLVDGADFFAYTLVASIAEHSGAQRVRALLHGTAAGRSLADLDRAQVERQWRRYLNRHCR